MPPAARGRSRALTASPRASACSAAAITSPAAATAAQHRPGHVAVEPLGGARVAAGCRASRAAATRAATTAVDSTAASGSSAAAVTGSQLHLQVDPVQQRPGHRAM